MREIHRTTAPTQKAGFLVPKTVWWVIKVWFFASIPIAIGMVKNLPERQAAKRWQ